MFEGFLEWAEGQGLPFKQWAEAMEERGIPPALLLLLLLLLLAAGAFLLFGQPPQTGTVVVYASTAGGDHVDNISISVTGLGEYQKSGVTSASGTAIFEKVPAGSVHVVASSKEVAFEQPSLDLDVKAGGRSEASFRAKQQQAEGVSLVVDVQNAPQATIKLFDSDGGLIDSVAETTSYSFSVARNTIYRVSAESEGYLAAEQEVIVADSNKFIELVLSSQGKITESAFHVRVFEKSVDEKPVANASVKLYKEDAVFASAKSSEDGSAPAFKVPFGSTIRMDVSAEGYDVFSSQYNISRLDQTATVELVPLTSAKLAQKGQNAIVIHVKDSAGNDVFSPFVRLYQKGEMRQEQFADDGTAIFNVSSMQGFSASVYKSGFLPAYLPSLKQEQTVYLNASTENNSGRVQVAVFDRLGNAVAGAAVRLLDEKLQPIGLPSRLTGSEGTQTFDDVPLEPIIAFASDTSHKKYGSAFVPDPATAESNATYTEIRFDPLLLQFRASVIDKFSRSPVASATVAVGNASCATDSKGLCVLRVDESDSVVATISASGYENFVSASFAVSSGQQERLFEVVSERVARDTKLRFEGVFDLSGRKVSSLDPLSEYEARYAISSPGIPFSKAEAFISMEGAASITGGQSQGARVTLGADQASTATQQVQEVTLMQDGFSPSSVDVVVGSPASFSNQDNVTHFLAFEDGQSLTLEPGMKKSLVFNKVGSFGFKSLRSESLTGYVSVSERESLAQEDAKSVLFEYPNFNNSRQVSVRFKTAEKGEVTLSHRSAFYTQTDVLRGPPDGVTLSQKLGISFAGTCTEEACVQYYFEYAKSKRQALELPLGEAATLKVMLVGVKDGAVVQITPTAGLLLLSGKNNQTTATISRNEAFLRVPAGRSENSFEFRGMRIASDASLKIQVLKQNQSVYEADAFLKVVSANAPALVVAAQPSKLEALAPTKVAFTVKDFLGQPVEGARATVGEAEAVASDKAPNIYIVEDVTAESLAPVPFEVTKEGFKTFRGSLAVEAPDGVLEVTPTVVALSVDSKEPSSSSVQLTNKLADALRVSISVSGGAGQITEVTVSPASLKLPGKGSASFELRAAIKEAVLEVARKAGSLREKVRGNVHIRASAKGFSTSKDVSFTVDSTFAQKGIDEVWLVSPDSLQFNLEPPKKKEESQQLTVSNTAPYPMVFNVEQTLGLSVEPASLILPAGGQGVFNVKAFMPREVDCFSDDVHKKGALSVYGSFQGISSKRTVQLALDVSTTGVTCGPSNGYRLVLPVDVRLTFLANTRNKPNTDGSTSVLLPTRELMWFGPGASVTPVDANVPQGTAFMLERYHVQQLPEGGWVVAFPTQALLAIPQDADRQPLPSGQTVVTLENAQIILPAGIPAGAQQSSQGVLVPPLAPVTFRPIPFNYDAMQNLLPPNPVEVKLPVDAVLDLPPGTVERKQSARPSSYQYLPKKVADDNLQNIKAIQLPSGERLAFGGDAAVVVEQGLVRLPASTSLHVSKGRVSAVRGLPIGEAFELRMPVAYSLSVTGSPVAFKTEEGKNALKLNDEAVVEALWKPVVTKATAGSVLRVVRENPLAYLKGAYSRMPVDPSLLAKCSFDYTPSEAVSFTLPTGTAVRKAAGGYEAILPNCDETSMVVFTTGSDEVLQTPSVKKITFPSDSEVSGDLADSEEKAVKATGKVVFTACVKDAQGKPLSEALSTARVSFREKSFIALPDRVLFGMQQEQSELDLGVLTKVSVSEGSKAKSSLGSTKKITIQRNGQRVTAGAPPQYPQPGLVFEKGSAVSFIPSCEKGSGRLEVQVSGEDVSVREKGKDKKEPLEVVFSNKDSQFKQVRTLCIYNKAKSTIIADGVAAEADPSLDVRYHGYLKGILDTSESHAYFAQSSIYGTKQKVNVEPALEGKEACREFTVEMELPEDMLYEGKCIKPELDGVQSDGLALKGSYVFHFRNANGEEMARHDNHVMPVNIKLDAKAEDCAALQERKDFPELLDVSVNYDTGELKALNVQTGSSFEKLYLKDVGHYTYFAIANNEENEVKIEEIKWAKGSSLLECRPMSGKAPEPVALSPGRVIHPAEILAVQCTSKAHGEDTLTIRFSGSSFNPSKSIDVQVFDPGAAAPLYQYSPIGKTLPFFNSRQSTLQERQSVAKTAGYSGLEFADAAAGTTATGAAPAAAPTTSDPDATDADAAAAAAKKPAAPTQTAAQKQQALRENLYDYRICKKYFCTFKQAQESVEVFTDAFSKLVAKRANPEGGTLATLQSLNDLCRPLLGGKKLQKVTLLQLTNAELDVNRGRADITNLETAIKTRAEFFRDIGEVRVTGAGSTLFSGCGLYQVRASLDPACGSNAANVDEWKKQMKLELQVSKLVDCPVNLANAALLTADDPVAYGGNQLGKGALNAVKQAFSKDTFKAVAAIPSALSETNENKVAAGFAALGKLRQGVLGTYGSEANDKDEAMVRALYASMYDVDSTKKQVGLCALPDMKPYALKPCAAKQYEDAPYCWRTGSPVLGTLATSAFALAVAQSIVASASVAGTGGLATPAVIARMILTNYRLTAALAGCVGAGAAESYAGRGAASCRAIDACTSTFLGLMVELVNPIGNWRLLQSEAEAVRATTTLAAAGSAGGAFLLQGLMTATVMHFLDEAGAAAGPPPVVPITVITRNIANPNLVQAGAIGSYRLFVSSVPGFGRQKQVEQYVKAFEAQGLYGANGRKTAADVFRALYDAGGRTSIPAGFNNPVMRAMSLLNPGQRGEIEHLIRSGNERAALSRLSEFFVENNPRVAQSVFLQSLNLEAVDASTQRLNRLEVFLNGLDATTQRDMLSHPNFKDVTFRVTKTTYQPMKGMMVPVKDEVLDKVSLFEAHQYSKNLRPPNTIITIEPRPEQIFDLSPSSTLGHVGADIRELLLRGETPLLAGHTPSLSAIIKGVDTLQHVDLTERLARIQAGGQAAFINDINARITDPTLRFPANAFAATGNAVADAEAIASRLLTLHNDRALQLNDLQLGFLRAGQPPLPNSFGGLVNELDINLKSVPGSGNIGKLREAFKMQGIYGRDGKLIPVTQELVEKAPGVETEARAAGAKKFLEADKRARLARGVGAVAAILATFLFNTDFRPVQVRVDATYGNSHVVGLHTEEGKPSAESLCILGVTDDCSSASSKNTLSVSQLCGGSSVCLRLLTWPNGQLPAYAVVGGFNDNAAPDAPFLSSIFAPEIPPVSQQEYARLKLSNAVINYGPLGANGFPQYQPEQISPADNIRATQKQFAQQIVDRMNEPDNVKALPADGRRKVQALAKQAIAAFNAKNDKKGNELLQQATTAEEALRSGAGVVR